MASRLCANPTNHGFVDRQQATEAHTDQAMAARTITTAMPVVNAMARAKITAIFFIDRPPFADTLVTSIG
jgi:hypothetical protein